METSGSIHALDEYALSEILVRLPSKSVLRCRAVCKQWRRITTDRAFLAAHAAHRPRQMLVVTASLTVSAVPLSLDPRPADDMGRRGYLCDPTARDKDGKVDSMGIPLASLDGLLVLRQGPDLFVVCNPMTRQWRKLPALSPRPCFQVFACGFYLHSPSGEYRLLCHGDTGGYYVLSAGAAVPRRLAHAPADRPLECHPAACRGILHWSSFQPEATRAGKMLAFDTVTEKFWLMARPPCNMLPMALLELDGALCAVAMQGVTLLSVWVLQDYESERWTLRNQVVVQPPKSLNDQWVSMAISGGGDAILIGHPRCSHLVRLCDLKEKKVRKQMDLVSVPTFLVFSESLVSHGFFDSRICSELGPIKFCD
ncbi:hypothetical protein HU200_019325 [Digitaria exilis]|uniref:F-box domain-containing protein n=1 Tax=Digitaria exilis TaxID=1010633 RepID=A0A835F318_9POAL|nr:hypothetical protein HU200_019325 [Digitaria exilis]